MKNIQLELDKLYADYLKTIFSDNEIFDKVKSSNFSSPLFIDINVKNGLLIDKKFKLLFIGQQTKGWDSNFSNTNIQIDLIPEYLNELKKLYLNFNYGKRLNGKNYNGYLWQFQRALLNIVNTNSDNNFGLLWSNILRFDEHGEKIKDEKIIEKVAYNKNEILRREIEIIKPDVVVFVTGRYYDWLLEKTFDDLTFNQSINKDLNTNKLTILESKYLPKLSFRTYHPRPLYENKQLRDSRGIIIETITKIIKDELCDE